MNFKSPEEHGLSQMPPHWLLFTGPVSRDVSNFKLQFCDKSKFIQGFIYEITK